MMQRFGFLFASVLLLAAPGCSRNSPLAPDPSAVRSGSTPLGAPAIRLNARAAGTVQVQGTLGPGTVYALFLPEHWNGDLVLYAHGYIVPEAPIALPVNDNVEPLRDLLLARGVAVGYSSFSANGFSVREGALQTGQLRGIFISKFGAPKRVFLMGHSLGGLVALMLAEEHPDLYAGALPISGVIAGSRRAIEYHANVRVLFDLFYPGVLPGSLLELPRPLDLNSQIIGPAVAAIQADPQGAFAISQITQTPVPFTSGEQLVASIVQALVFHAIELQDMLDRTHGHSFFDNSSTVYTGALPPQVLAFVNARVRRYAISPDAAAFLNQYYEPTGQLEIPVLTLHTRWDPVAPLFHEDRYRDLVLAAGRSDLLEQRVVDRYGHGGFTAEEMAAAFDDLAARAGASAAARRIETQVSVR